MWFLNRPQDNFRDWRLGRACDKTQAFSNQPVFTIKEEDLYVVEIEEEDMILSVTLVCSCDLPVKKIGEDEFTCLHCDRVCEVRKCIWCKGLDLAFKSRFGE